MKPRYVIASVRLVIVVLATAWIQRLVAGLPAVSGQPTAAVSTLMQHGFPAWLRLTHYVNLVFLVLMARSGASILMDRIEFVESIETVGKGHGGKNEGDEFFDLLPEIRIDRSVWAPAAVAECPA